MQVASASCSCVLAAASARSAGQQARRLPLAVFQQQVRTGASSAARIPRSTQQGTSSTAASTRSSAPINTYIKTYKPLTPGLRHVKHVVHPHLHKGGPLRELTSAMRKNGGRNNTGRITTRARGGGHRRRHRLIDFIRQTEGPHTVERIEYDPGRTAHIALVTNDATGEQSYILAPDGLRAGDKVQSWPKGVDVKAHEAAAASLNTDPSAPQSVTPPSAAESQEEQPEELQTSLLRASMLRTGNQLPLYLIPPGTTIHCISTIPYKKASLCRSAGSSAKMAATESAGSKGQLYAQIQLKSGEVRKFHRNCTAVIGSVSNREHQNVVLGKAGRKRWLGFKPKVRGMAMNA
jgi:ribosomal protein L2